MVGDKLVIDALDEGKPPEGKAALEKGKKVPVVLEFVSYSGDAELHLSWQWAGQERAIVPPAALSHDPNSHPDTTKDIIAAKKK
jgi:hypothetical protein